MTLCTYACVFCEERANTSIKQPTGEGEEGEKLCSVAGDRHAAAGEDSGVGWSQKSQSEAGDQQ